MSDLLQGLNDAQRDAVSCTEGPLLVLAAAGSGKTRVITRRAAYLATTVSDPRHVLAITFTNKAAGEMRARMEVLGFGREMLICTFHALCVRLLRWHATEAGVAPNFTIFDEADRRAVVRQAVADAGVSSTQWSPAVVHRRISEAKAQLLTPKSYAESPQGAGYAGQVLARIYAHYQRLLAEQQALDFDDLLVMTAQLLGDHPQVRAHLEDRFRYVLIDEYQDTNHTQYLIARGLTLRRENLCATGDPDQSIYGWRGADIRNILEFEQDFPKARIIRLEQNYRSTARILSAADALIKVNCRRKDKALWTQNAGGAAVRVVARDRAEDEADFLVAEIQAQVAGGGSLDDVAVFYRVNSLSRIVEEAFLRAGVPYQIARGTEFYNRKEIKDVLAYLRLLVNPADELALRRSINTPSRGIGKTSIDRLLAFAHAGGLSALEAARRAAEIPGLKRAAEPMRAYVDLVDGLRLGLDEPADEVLRRVLAATGLEDRLAQGADQDDDALRNLAELVSAASDFVLNHPENSLLDWLQHVSLVSDVDRVDAQAGAVTLMTLHAAKGLEYPRVYIIALEDGILPHERYLEDRDAIEEERRLCFVGMTRARQFLTLSHACWRAQRGRLMRTTESRFLAELPPDEVEWQRDARDDRDDTAPPPQPAGEFRHWPRGMYLRHPRYGAGQLLWTQPSGDGTRAAIRFPAYGEKVFILEYSGVQPLDPDECQL